MQKIAYYTRGKKHYPAQRVNFGQNRSHPLLTVFAAGDIL